MHLKSLLSGIFLQSEDNMSSFEEVREQLRYEKELLDRRINRFFWYQAGVFVTLKFVASDLKSVVVSGGGISLTANPAKA